MNRKPSRARRILASVALGAVLCTGLPVTATAVPITNDDLGAEVVREFYALETGPGFYKKSTYRPTPTSTQQHPGNPPHFGIRKFTYDENFNITAAPTLLGGVHALENRQCISQTPAGDVAPGSCAADIKLTRILNDPEFTTAQVLNENLNSLGAAGDGVFYFTGQLGLEAQQDTVSIYRYTVDEDSPETPGTVERLVDGFALNSRGGGSLVGGAVNPRDGNYYFMYFSSFASKPSPEAKVNYDPINDPDGWQRIVRAHLYRLSPEAYADSQTNPAGQIVAGEVAHLDMEVTAELPLSQQTTEAGQIVPLKNSSAALVDGVAPNLMRSLNGDISFDADGNLVMVASVAAVAANDTRVAQVGGAFKMEFGFENFAGLVSIDPLSGDPVPTVPPTNTIGGRDQSALPLGAGLSTMNGIAFVGKNDLIVQQQAGALYAQTVIDPTTFLFRPLAVSQTAAERSSRQVTQVIERNGVYQVDSTPMNYVDLASSVDPAHFSASVVAQPGVVGVGVDGSATISQYNPFYETQQTEKNRIIDNVGFLGAADSALQSVTDTHRVLPDGTLRAELEMTGTNGSTVQSAYACFVMRSTGERGPVLAQGNGVSAAVVYRDHMTAGQHVHCEFTLTTGPVEPALKPGGGGEMSAATNSDAPAQVKPATIDRATKLEQTGAAFSVPFVLAATGIGGALMVAAGAVLLVRRRTQV